MKAGTFAAVLLAGMFAALLSQAARDAATYDEPHYLASGYYYWKTGDFSFIPLNPPLARLFSSVPLLFMEPALADPSIDVPLGPDRNRSEKFLNYGKKFLFQNNVPADRILFWGRFVMALFTVLGGWFVWAWSRRLFGETGGLISLACYVLNPNLLAHGHLATTDMIVGVGMVGCSYFWWRYLQAAGAAVTGAAHAAPVTVAESRADEPPWQKNIILALSGIMLGVAVASKQTGWALLPVLLLTGGLKRWRELLGVVAVAFCVLFVSYGFSFAEFSSSFGNAFLIFSGSGRSAKYFNYLNGVLSETGFKKFYIMAMGIKTPVTLFILLVAGAGVLLRVDFASKRSDRGGSLLWNGMPHSAWAPVLVPAALVFAAGSLSSMQLGIRYILPVFVYLSVAAGVFAKRYGAMLSAAGMSWAGRAAGVFAALFIVVAAVDVWHAWPATISYISPVFGGTQRGHEYLVESSLDWGQDLKLLAKWEANAPAANCFLTFSYFGQDDPVYRGIVGQNLLSKDFNPDIRYTTPGRDYFAVSATHRAGLYTGDPQLFDWLRTRQSAALLGGTIFIYDITYDDAAHRKLAEIFYRVGNLPACNRELARAAEIIKSRANKR